MPKVFISTTSFSKFSDKPLSLINERGFNIKLNNKNRRLFDNEIADQLMDCDGVIAGTENYTENILSKLKKLKVISRVGVGMDNIDIESAEKLGIKIFMTSTSPAPAVAELVLGLIIDVMRKISLCNYDLKLGKWDKRMGSLLHGKTLGIIGMGTIGKTLVKLVRGFKLKILACDLIQDQNFQIDYNITYCDMEKVFKESDIVSIHLNLSDQTKKIVNKDLLSLMKQSAILINTSRGEIIDEKALYDAIKSNKITGAGLDVFEREPYIGPLTELNNVVLTPHIGSYAKEIRIRMELEAVENLIKGLEKK